MEKKGAYLLLLFFLLLNILFRGVGGKGREVGFAWRSSSSSLSFLGVVNGWGTHKQD